MVFTSQNICHKQFRAHGARIITKNIFGLHTMRTSIFTWCSVCKTTLGIDIRMPEICPINLVKTELGYYVNYGITDRGLFFFEQMLAFNIHPDAWIWNVCSKYYKYIDSEYVASLSNIEIRHFLKTTRQRKRKKN